MRRILFNIHLCLALAAGLFLVILGATGAIMAFEPELDHLLHSEYAYVQTQARPMSLAEIGAAVTKAYPGERIGSYLFPASPSLSYVVALRGKQIYVNPYTGAVLGVRAAGPDLLSRVHQLHLRLLLTTPGDPGKKVMSWPGVTLVLLALSGLYLWWPYMQVKVRRPFRSRRFWLDLHNAVGICSFAFLLLLAFTGVIIGFEETTVPAFYRMTGSQPVQPPRSFAPPPPGARPIGVDAAVAIAQSAIPGAEPFQVNVPPPRGAYLVRSRFPEDLTPGGRSLVMVDQYTGQTLFTQSSRTAPAGTRMVILNRAIHTGDIFGLPSKILMSLVSLALVLQALTGAAMWWKRTRKNR